MWVSKILKHLNYIRKHNTQWLEVNISICDIGLVIKDQIIKNIQR